MFRKRIGSAAEEIDVLSAIPPTARNVLKLPSGVILRAIVIEIIFACLPGEACRTFHFMNSLSEGTFRAIPFTPPYTFLFHLIGHRFTEENTKRCFALRNGRNGENRIVYSTAIPSVIISLKLFFTHSFTISISFHARLSISSSANKNIRCTSHRNLPFLFLQGTLIPGIYVLSNIYIYIYIYI